ncbi:conserved hypothetical protein [Candidatus Roizmanbacteria bacterium]|nr:conserved hypothetical protein [Candidatus Roizmanbacteria bacterium]
MKPFFSVVIPTLNEEKFIPKLLNDLSKQSEKDFEVIVDDGFSKDGTKKVVDKFNRKLNIKFYQTELTNVATQRNHGASKSLGNYLVFIDADTRISPAFLAKVKKNIFKKKGLLFLPYFLPDKEYKQYKLLFDLANIFVELSQNLPKRFSLGGSIIIEKNFFEKISGFNEKLFISEDHELVQRASEWGVNSKFIKEAKIYFSLRRMKKEGQLKYFYKFFNAATRRLFLNEEIKKKIFEYQMGGQLYDKKPKIKKEEFFNHYFNQIKELFNRLLED